MIKRVDFRIVALAFLVAVSHIALVSHVTAHFEPALEQCELCVGQAHPLPAIPTPESGAEIVPFATAPVPDYRVREINDWMETIDESSKHSPGAGIAADRVAAGACPGYG